MNAVKEYLVLDQGDRMRVYEAAKTLIDEGAKNQMTGKYIGICAAMDRALLELGSAELVPMYAHPNQFPELLEEKPKNIREGNGYWFPVNTEMGRAKRVVILENCINKCLKL